MHGKEAQRRREEYDDAMADMRRELDAWQRRFPQYVFRPRMIAWHYGPNIQFCSGREVSRTDAWRMACEQASQQAAKVIKAQQELASAQ